MLSSLFHLPNPCYGVFPRSIEVEEATLTVQIPAAEANSSLETLISNQREIETTSSGEALVVVIRAEVGSGLGRSIKDHIFIETQSLLRPLSIFSPHIINITSVLGVLRLLIERRLFCRLSKLGRGVKSHRIIGIGSTLRYQLLQFVVSNLKGLSGCV